MVRVGGGAFETAVASIVVVVNASHPIIFEFRAITTHRSVVRSAVCQRGAYV